MSEGFFNSRVERKTRFELATLSLAILLSLPHTVADAPFAQFDLYSKPLKTAPHCLRLFQSVRYNKFTTIASISGHIVDRVTSCVMVTNDDGEVTEARSLCSCVHCRLSEATVPAVISAKLSCLRSRHFSEQSSTPRWVNYVLRQL